LEVKVFSNLRKTWSQDLYFLKREVIEFRRAVEPLRPLLARIASAETARVPDDVRPFFRDIDDHVNRAADTVSGLDQLIQAALDADIAQLQLRQNEDMRKITAWVALGAIPTLVAGIYGMNFTFIPGMHSEWGFAGVVGVLTVTCMSLYAKFKKSGWL
jgi:magnesium transporter